MSDRLYVSITGLQLKRPWHVIAFYRLAVPCLHAARATNGNLRAEARTIAGVHHTLSVWESEDAMRAFVYSPVHMKAIRAFGSIATGKTFGFHTARIPHWAEIHRMWRARAVEYEPAA